MFLRHVRWQEGTIFLFSLSVIKAVSTLLFTHKNGDLGAISATEQSCDLPISKVESHISGRCLLVLNQMAFTDGTKSYPVYSVNIGDAVKECASLTKKTIKKSYHPPTKNKQNKIYPAHPAPCRRPLWSTFLRARVTISSGTFEIKILRWWWGHSPFNLKCSHFFTNIISPILAGDSYVAYFVRKSQS